MQQECNGKYQIQGNGFQKGKGRVDTEISTLFVQFLKLGNGKINTLFFPHFCIS